MEWNSKHVITRYTSAGAGPITYSCLSDVNPEKVFETRVASDAPVKLL